MVSLFADKYLFSTEEVELKSIVPTLQSCIGDSFKKSCTDFKKAEKSLNIGDFVLAQMRGYAPWPARITSFTKNRKRVSCYFYGSHNNGPVDVNKVFPFENGYETIRLISIRNPPGFQKAVKELEMAFGIPKHLNSLREILSVM